MATATLDIPRIAQLCNALADETRVEIVARLLDGEKCVCDLTDALETGQSRLSYHLKVLKDAGLVTDRREGMVVLHPRAERIPRGWGVARGAQAEGCQNISNELLLIRRTAPGVL